MSDTTKPPVRAKVLAAALAAIAERGPDRVRVQDVAERAGMSPGHVMYYFGSKDRILVDTLLLSEADLAERRDRRIASASSPSEALERFVRLYLPAGPDDVRWRLWAGLVARPPRDEETRRAVAEATDGWTATLAAILGPVHAERACRLMDGYALEVLLGTAGRGRARAVKEVLAAIGALVHDGGDVGTGGCAGRPGGAD